MATTDLRAEGNIFWFDDCPRLTAGDPKRRPIIIVISTDFQGQPIDPVIVVPTTTGHSSDHDAVTIPSTQENPLTATGLPSQCQALPRFYFAAYRDELDTRNHIGRVPGAILYALTEYLSQRLDEPESETHAGG